MSITGTEAENQNGPGRHKLNHTKINLEKKIVGLSGKNGLLFYVASTYNGNYTLSTTRGFMSPFRKFMIKPKRKDEMESTVRIPTK